MACREGGAAHGSLRRSALVLMSRGDCRGPQMRCDSQIARREPVLMAALRAS